MGHVCPFAPNFSNPIFGTCERVEVSFLITSSIKYYYGFVNLLFVFLMCVCLFVCLFSGNIRGERPYEQGTPCSRCPSNKPSCEANLCAQQATNTGAPSSSTTESPSPSTTEPTTEASTSTSVVLIPSFLGLSVLSLINTHNFVIV